MQELFIDTPEQLQTLCSRLVDSEWLALDTEFLREKTYYPKFCLLQIANAELAACIDPLAIDDLSPLQTLLEHRHITKVFHAGYQDLEIFYHLWGQIPQPIFDTQLAATLIGLGDQIGYAPLIKQLLGKTLDKGQVRTDWSRRPLEEEQRRYALDDVIYLGTAYLQLKERLEALGRIDWLAEDFTTLSDPATYKIQPENQWARIRGRQQLKGAQLAILQALAAWREQRAATADKPKGWILKDEVLLDLARRAPKERHQLGRIRGLEPRTQERWGDTLLELITEARQLPPEQWPQEAAAPPRLDVEQEALVDILMCVVRLRAKEQHLSPQALTSHKELERLAAGEENLEIHHGWRRALIGDDLLKALKGELWPRLQNGRVTLSQIGSKDS
jgi:ribonuclease D